MRTSTSICSSVKECNNILVSVYFYMLQFHLSLLYISQIWEYYIMFARSMIIFIFNSYRSMPYVVISIHSRSSIFNDKLFSKSLVIKSYVSITFYNHIKLCCISTCIICCYYNFPICSIISFCYVNTYIFIPCQIHSYVMRITCCVQFNYLWIRRWSNSILSIINYFYSYRTITYIK